MYIEWPIDTASGEINWWLGNTQGLCIVYTAIVCWYFHTYYTGKIFGRQRYNGVRVIMESQCIKTDTVPRTFWIVLTQRNAGWKTWNNDYQGLLAAWRNFFINLTSVKITSSETFSLILFINKVSVVIAISKTFKFVNRSQY